MQTRTKELTTVTCIISTMAVLGYQTSEAAVLSVDLGSAANYAVLAGAGITIAGPGNSTTITGDIGSHATTSITGLENLILYGTNQAGNAITQTAKTDLMTAYMDAAARPFDGPAYGDGFGLTGTLTTGVYHSAGSFSLNGPLTLDALGDPNAVWIFQMASTLDVASAGQVVLANGAQASNVFWQVGSSANLGTGSQLSGSILASQSITLNTGAVLDGRALASIGAVSMGSATVTVPEPSAALLVALGVGGFLASRRRG